METKNAAAARAAAAGSVKLVDTHEARVRVPATVRALLRIPLFYKLVIANGVITVTAVLACAALVAGGVRANAGSSTRLEVWIIIAIAAAIGVIVNALVVRVALSPVRNLIEAAVSVRAGGEDVRAVESAIGDAATAEAVTAFNTMLDSLAAYRRRLRDIAIRAVDAGETERARLSRELHDGVAQGLAAVLVQLRVAQRTAVGTTADQLAGLSEQITGSINELRSLAQSLRPPALDMIGLSAAITSHARHLGAATGLRVDVRAEGIDNVLANEAELALYRLVQEALQNVAQHANTKHAIVDVVRTGDVIRATVVDKGRGFNVDAALADGALGLYGMYERALYAGGEVEIQSAPGQGTVVRVSFPVGDRTDV